MGAVGDGIRIGATPSAFGDPSSDPFDGKLEPPAPPSGDSEPPAAADVSFDQAVDRILAHDTFKRLPRRLHATLRRAATVLEPAGPKPKPLLKQDARNDGVLYMVLSGEVETRHKPLSTYVDLDETIMRHGPGELLGHASMLTARPVQATIVPRPGAVVAEIDLRNRRRLKDVAAARELLQRPLARYTAAQRRRTGMLEDELELARLRIAAATPLISTLAMMSLYTMSLSLVPDFQALLPVNFVYTPILIVVLSIVSWVSIWASGVKKAFFGICLRNTGSDLLIAAFYSLLFVGALLGAKYWAIKNLPAFEGMPLFAPSQVTYDPSVMSETQALWIAFALYAVFAPFQELVARCGLQAPLQAILDYKERPYWVATRVLIAILVSNLVFAAAHAHLSLQFAIAAFVPGLLWGWIFYRTNSLLAVSLSHIFVGAAGLFLLGIEDVLVAIEAMSQ